MHWPSFFSWKIETVLFFLKKKEKNGFKKGRGRALPARQSLSHGFRRDSSLYTREPLTAAAGLGPMRASAKGIFHKKEAIYGIQQNWAHQ